MQPYTSFWPQNRETPSHMTIHSQLYGKLTGSSNVSNLFFYPSNPYTLRFSTSFWEHLKQILLNSIMPHCDTTTMKPRNLSDVLLLTFLHHIYKHNTCLMGKLCQGTCVGKHDFISFFFLKRSPLNFNFFFFDVG